MGSAEDGEAAHSRRRGTGRGPRGSQPFPSVPLRAWSGWEAPTLPTLFQEAFLGATLPQGEAAAQTRPQHQARAETATGPAVGHSLKRRTDTCGCKGTLGQGHSPHPCSHLCGLWDMARCTLGWEAHRGTGLHLLTFPHPPQPCSHACGHIPLAVCSLTCKHTHKHVFTPSHRCKGQSVHMWTHTGVHPYTGMCAHRS